MQIVIHDADHQPISAGIVTGVWSDGQTAICAVTYNVCSVASVPTSVRKMTFTVTGVSAGVATYDPARNHDVDSETNGTSVTITKR